MQDFTLIQLDNYEYISLPNYQAREKTVVMIHQVKIALLARRLQSGWEAEAGSEAAEVSGNNNKRASQQLEVKVRQEAGIPG